jgi:hypothetical protein
MIKFLISGAVLLSMLNGTQIFSKNNAASMEHESGNAQLQKVGGDYVVEKIEKLDRGFFIKFVAKNLTGEADVIELYSDHVHFGVTKGSKLRLSAEVVKTENKKTVQAAQVLLYLPAPEGFLPVWLLSQNSQGFEKGSTSYLKMHAPQSDYMVF